MDYDVIYVKLLKYGDIIPKPPKEGEKKEDFMKRCVPVYINEGYPKEQATAMCYTMWRDKHPNDKKNSIWNDIEHAVTLKKAAERLAESIYKDRGDGQGQDGDRQGDGGADTCVCPSCGYETEHERDKPCSEMTCPECGAELVGKNKENSYEHIGMKLRGNISIVNKSNDEKVIAGYASIAVVDTEDEYVPVEVLKEGLNTLVSDDSYSNIMIVHKNIQIGKILKKYKDLKTHVDDKGLYIVAEMRDDLEIAKETWKQIEDGELRGFSIGGEILDDHKECDDDGCIKVIDKINLFEVSVCSCPVNEDSGFDIVNKSYVSEMLKNCKGNMKENKEDVPEKEEKAKEETKDKSEDCEDCSEETIDNEESKEEEKSDDKEEPKEDILSKSDIIETIKETIEDTLKSYKEDSEEEKKPEEEPEEEKPKKEEKSKTTEKSEDAEEKEETKSELKMALKARDEVLEGYEKKLENLEKKIKALEDTEEKPKKVKKNSSDEESKDSGIIFDHGKIYKE